MNASINRLKQLDSKITLVRYTTPKNIAQAKEQFFATHHTPILIYNAVPKKRFLKYKDELLHLDITQEHIDPDLLSLYKRKKEEIIERIDLLLQQSKSEFYQMSESYFDIHFLEAYIDKAKVRSEQYKDVTKQTSDTTALAKMFREVLHKNKLDMYKISLSNKSGFNIRPNTTTKTVSISKHAHTDFLSIKAIIMHELVHIIRYENAQGIDPIFQIRTKHSLGYEEGIATYIEDMFSHGSIYQHAVEYLGCVFARSHSFVEVFTFLINYGFSEDLAWQRAIRMKFGVSNTNHIGVYAKTATYFEKMLEAKEYMAKGNDLNDLLVGKICLSDIQIYKKVYPNRTLTYSKEIFSE